MYSEKEKVIALNYCHQVKSVTKVIRQLCYPTRSTLYEWLSKSNEQPKEKRYSCGTNFPEHPRNPWKLQEGNIKRTMFGTEELLDKINEMQMEIDILKEIINVLKKRPRHRPDNSKK